MSRIKKRIELLGYVVESALLCVYIHPVTPTENRQASPDACRFYLFTFPWDVYRATKSNN